MRGRQVKDAVPGLYSSFEGGDYGYSRVQDLPQQASSTKSRRQRREKGRQGWWVQWVFVLRAAVFWGAPRDDVSVVHKTQNFLSRLNQINSSVQEDLKMGMISYSFSRSLVMAGRIW